MPPADAGIGTPVLLHGSPSPERAPAWLRSGDGLDDVEPVERIEQCDGVGARVGVDPEEEVQVGLLTPGARARRAARRCKLAFEARGEYRARA